MAATASRSTDAPPFVSPSRTRDDRPGKRKKDQQRTDIWSNLLRQTRDAQARNRTHTVQARSLLVCGGSSDDQHAFVQSLARPPASAPASRTREQKPTRARGEVKLSNRFACGYGHVTLFSPPAQQGVGGLGTEPEEAARFEVHTLPEPDRGYERTLRTVLELKGKKEEEGDKDDALDENETSSEEGRRPAVAILLSWKEPWKFLAQLQRWLQLLSQSLLPPDALPEDPVEVLKEHAISLTVVVQHVEAQEALEREGYKEEGFDYISQCLRTCVLPLAAGLVYLSSLTPPQQPGSALSELQKVLFTSMSLDLVPLSPAPAKSSTPAKREDLAPKHNVVDRMAIVVPSGWDSVGKIRLLSETFSPESVLDSWSADLNNPSKQLQSLSPADDLKDGMPSSPSPRNNGVDQEQTTYATSDMGDADEEELADRPESPSKAQRSAISAYEDAVLDPAAHKAPKQINIDVTTKEHQAFLADMRAHLQSLEVQDAERAKTDKSSSQSNGAATPGRMVGLPAGEQTGALNDLGDVSFNVGGIAYNTVTMESAIERLKRGHSFQSEDRSESPVASGTPRTQTPRPPRRNDDRESSTPTVTTPGSKTTDLPMDKLEEYFASLMKKGGGSGANTPSKPPPS